MSDAKELADELDAIDRLKKRGYKLIICRDCQGTGGCWSEHEKYPFYRRCFTCGGKGAVWVFQQRPTK